MDVMGWDVASGIDWNKFFLAAIKADWNFAMTLANNANLNNFGEFDWKKLYDLVVENADENFIAKLTKNWDKSKLGKFDWNQLYERALVEANNAFIGDRTGDVQRMIDESETYYGRRGSSSGSWQVGLWQHIKFQTLDTSSVETDIAYEVYVNQALVSVSFTNIGTDITLVGNNDDDNLNIIEYQPLENIDLSEKLTTSQPAEGKVTAIKELESFDLSELDDLGEQKIEVLNSLNDDVVMPIK
jgi:hypothetical protein